MYLVNSTLLVVLRLRNNAGIDRSFATNYLSHVLLTEKLLPLLAKAKKGARVLQMTSSYHWQVRSLNSRDSIDSSVRRQPSTSGQ